jgi:hypothetical protein
VRDNAADSLELSVKDILQKGTNFHFHYDTSEIKYHIKVSPEVTCEFARLMQFRIS